VSSEKIQKTEQFPYVSDDRKAQILQTFEILNLAPALPYVDHPYFREFTLLKSEGIQFSTSSSSV